MTPLLKNSRSGAFGSHECNRWWYGRIGISSCIDDKGVLPSASGFVVRDETLPSFQGPACSSSFFNVADCAVAFGNVAYLLMLADCLESTLRAILRQRVSLTAE